MAFTEAQVTKIVEYAKERTHAFNAKIFGIPAKPKALPELSPKGAAIVTILNESESNDYVKQMATVFSGFLGEDLTPHVTRLQKAASPRKRDITDAKEWVAGVVVVPTGNDNSHSYPLGEPAIYIGDQQYCVRSNGSLGNHLTTNTTQLRAATDAEIEAAVRRNAVSFVDKAKLLII